MATRKTTKTLDKWKTKQAFEIVAPEIFNGVVVGETVTGNPNSFIGRTVDVTLGTLAPSKPHHVKITLAITGTSGFKALTEIKEIELSRAYIVSQVGKDAMIVENVFDVKSKDGKAMRVKTALFTNMKVHSSQRCEMRRICEKTIGEMAAKSNGDQFLQEVAFGKIGSTIFSKCKKIVPLRRAEVRRVEVKK